MILRTVSIYPAGGLVTPGSLFTIDHYRESCPVQRLQQIFYALHCVCYAVNAVKELFLGFLGIGEEYSALAGILGYILSVYVKYGVRT